ncbi:MAG: hypothetical protein IT292_10340 [Deltaproteobacteria bacterium]|nr:hypothetical protein [Deltaproteobacteria bacterium]
MNLADLNNIVQESLSHRLQANANYQQEEITKLTNKSARLFPKDFAIDEELCNQLRSLCQLSQVSLKPSNKITSHRKFIGPLIVALKKMTYPLIKVHLDDSFKGIAAMNAWLVESHAKQALRIKELEKQLSKS